MGASSRPVRDRAPGVVLTSAVGLTTLAVASLVVVGADALWGVAQGRAVLDQATPTPELAYAAARPDWAAPLALGWVLLALADGAGPAGLAAGQVAVAALTLWFTGVEARAWGAGRGAAAVVVVLTLLGAAQALVIMRLPTLSLLPFVALAALLRREHGAPSRRIWLSVPLLALWANVHGGVVVGLALLGAYLAFSRLRQRLVESLLVGLAAVAALCITPLGLGTWRYFHEVFGNEAAVRHTDLWARMSMGNPFDLATIGVVAVLLVGFVRARPPLWEMAAVAGLVAGTAQVARNGTWLVLFLAPMAFCAARSGVRSVEASTSREPWLVREHVVPAVVVVVLASVVLALRGPEVHPRGTAVVEEVARIAAGRTVLADEPLVETLLARGVPVWAGNPIDALPPGVQRAYLDVLHGSGAGGVPAGIRVVVVERGSPAATVIAEVGGWHTVTSLDGVVVLERSS